MRPTGAGTCGSRCVWTKDESAAAEDPERVYKCRWCVRGDMDPDAAELVKNLSKKRMTSLSKAWAVPFPPGKPTNMQLFALQLVNKVLGE